MSDGVADHSTCLYRMLFDASVPQLVIAFVYNATCHFSTLQ